MTLSLLLAVIVVGAAAVPAAGKEGIKATLATSVPLDTESGARLRVAWTLEYAEGESRGQPFGANGVFVRLLSASGAAASTGFAPTGDHAGGEYAATVVVPEGGIGDVEIGLRGVTSGVSGTRRADVLFPITNDPVPGPARVASPASEPGEPRWAVGGSTAWILVVGLTALVATCALAVGIARRNQAIHASPRRSV